MSELLSDNLGRFGLRPCTLCQCKDYQIGTLPPCVRCQHGPEFHAGDDKLRIDNASKEIESICKKPNSPSKFYRYGGAGYKCGISHYFLSSCEVAYCAVEPGNVDDLIAILNVIKKYQVRFAIKGGGHTSNANFSSTTGIQISMVQFNDITYDSDKETLAIGAGCLFDEVYRDTELNKARRNIVGGEDFQAVGVAGWYLGGGYSMKTNQFGLGIDNILAYKVVVPGGVGERPRLESVKSDEEEPNKRELFWALKGGGNNFGIVTEFTLATHPQDRVYGGALEYDENKVGEVKEAILEFLGKSDKRATIKAYFRHLNTSKGIQFKLLVYCNYDVDPSIPDSYNPFQMFLDIIPHSGELKGYGLPHPDNQPASSNFDESTSELAANAETASLGNTSVPNGLMAGIGENARGRWGCVMLGEYSAEILRAVDEQAKQGAENMPKKGGKMFTICCKPFIKGMFDKISTDPTRNGAWPHKKDEPNHPLVVFTEWEGKENDQFWIGEMKRVLGVLSEPIPRNNLPVYSNTALAELTRVEEVYRGNLEELKRIRSKVDPEKVMSRTGGFKIPA